ncbi:hypothetical protein [Novosphingobium ginsenosidimutans]|uniref:Uncharacterized protein n=1 Tax=Novosphingobium ginsenosidimutans TaxID=1176536 RepID=A0A5B8S4G7_9SPHN|nr:hypothetical protein [Novosphingobium ginsenosidimutans]QEA15607.1 hypothetical protein FRF71_05350 [Novosphingobium ginsenosidimutans]
MSFSHVIKPEELSALDYLASDHPRPIAVQWINRGTDRPLRKQSIDLLLRTLFSDVLSESVVKLHRTSGLRVEFRSENERHRFARDLAAAKLIEQQNWTDRITMIFSEQTQASAAAEALVEIGISKTAVSILWRAGRFMDADTRWIEGHSLLSVAGATASGSIAGLALGVALIAVPGVGQIAAIGGLAASATSAAPALVGIFGATAAAIRKMLSDPDVEDVARKQFMERQNSSPVFVTVDLSLAQDAHMTATKIMKQHGGRAVGKRV